MRYETFEDFPVYKMSVQLAKEINSLSLNIKNISFNFLKDQARRASSSIVLNIAEGAGKWGKKDKANYYRTSRGSCYECLAAIDLFEAYGLINTDKSTEIKDDLKEIANSLNALMSSIEKR
ncbi:MAG: four helix bundle protein [Candidatus Margulisiibacteriota bacterium]